MNSKEPIFYLNGKFVPKSKAIVSVYDLGWVRGYGVFDYIITYDGGKPFMMMNHLNRLKRSAELIGLKLPFTQERLQQIIVRVLKKNRNGKEKSIRIVVTGGVSENTLTVPKKPTLAILVNDRKPYPIDFYKKGIKVIIYDYNRESPQAKSLNYIHGVKAMNLAAREDAYEAIYVNKKADRVYEATTSNLFLVKNKKVVTPNGDTLPGITRELIIKISSKFFPTQVREVKIKELYDANELFITASNKEIMPVVKVDNKVIGKGIPGEVTKKIMSEFRKFVDSGNW